MSEAEAKVIEKQSSSSMPTLTTAPEPEVPTDLPTELVLAILYSQAKNLEGKALAQILTGTSPKGEPVTYIRMTGVSFVKGKGFVLAVEKSANTSE